MRPSIEKQISALGWVLHGVGLAVAVVVIAALHLVRGSDRLRKTRMICQQRIDQLEAMLKLADHEFKRTQEIQTELVSLKQSVEETQRRLPRELSEDEFLAQVRQDGQRRQASSCGEYQLGLVDDLESYSKARLDFSVSRQLRQHLPIP